MPNSSVYAATKAAVASLARSLSTELAPKGIRLNIVNPTLVIQSTGPQRVNDARWNKVRRGRRWRTTAVDGAVSVEFLRDGSVVDKGLRDKPEK